MSHLSDKRFSFYSSSKGDRFHSELVLGYANAVGLSLFRVLRSPYQKKSVADERLNFYNTFLSLSQRAYSVLA
jgi:hypothetical protein